MMRIWDPKTHVEAYYYLFPIVPTEIKLISKITCHLLLAQIYIC